MRVAFAIDNFNIGGTELNAVRSAECLVGRGIEVVVVALQRDGPIRARYEDAGIPIHVFETGSFLRPRAWRRAAELSAFCRKMEVDIVHAHDMYTNVLAVPVARLSGVPFVVASRRWWEPPTRGYALANRAAYRFADAVLANSQTIRQHIMDDEGVAGEKVRVVPNFLGEEAFQRPPPGVIAGWRRELGVPGEAQVVGCVANLNPVKDHATLVSTFAGLARGVTDKPVYLVLVGDGPCRPDLERQAVQLGVGDQVRFAGRRGSQPSFHWMFDVSVLTSTSEGLPNTLLEAMAAGRPVVATSVGAVADLVDDTVGRLVAPTTPFMLLSALQELTADPSLRSSLGAAGRKRARQRYHVDAVMDELVGFYEDGLRTSRGRRQQSGSSHVGVQGRG